MSPLTEAQVRGAICNASRGERTRMHLPDLAALPWDDLDVLGWRDPKAPQRGYLVQGPGEGVQLRAPESVVRRTAQCLLCHCVHEGDVALFVAPRAGEAGRRGNTVGVYVCADLQCSAHLREELKPSRQLPDPTPVLAARVAGLHERLRAFLAAVQR